MRKPSGRDSPEKLQFIVPGFAEDASVDALDLLSECVGPRGFQDAIGLGLRLFAFLFHVALVIRGFDEAVLEDMGEAKVLAADDTVAAQQPATTASLSRYATCWMWRTKRRNNATVR